VCVYNTSVKNKGCRKKYVSRQYYNISRPPNTPRERFASTILHCTSHTHTHTHTHSSHAYNIYYLVRYRKSWLNGNLCVPKGGERGAGVHLVTVRDGGVIGGVGTGIYARRGKSRLKPDRDIRTRLGVYIYISNIYISVFVCAQER